MALRRYFGKISPLLINQLVGHEGEFVIDEELVDGVNLEGYPPQLHAAVVYRVQDSMICHVTFLM